MLSVTDLPFIPASSKLCVQFQSKEWHCSLWNNVCCVLRVINFSPFKCFLLTCSKNFLKGFHPFSSLFTRSRRVGRLRAFGWFQSPLTIPNVSNRTPVEQAKPRREHLNCERPNSCKYIKHDLLKMIYITTKNVIKTCKILGAMLIITFWGRGGGVRLILRAPKAQAF